MTNELSLTPEGSEFLLREMLSKAVPFDQDEVDLAIKHFRFKTYRPKDFIFSCGDVVQDICFVLDGIGRYFYVDKEGVERNKSLAVFAVHCRKSTPHQVSLACTTTNLTGRSGR